MESCDLTSGALSIIGRGISDRPIGHQARGLSVGSGCFPGPRVCFGGHAHHAVESWSSICASSLIRCDARCYSVSPRLLMLRG